MKVRIAGHDLLLHPAGVMIWQDQDLLIVSDLHLEKGSHFARRGYFLPPYDSRETLERLLAVLVASKCKNLLVLGDCFHDCHGYERLGPEEKEMFEKLYNFSPVWIKGNHDGDFVPPCFSAYNEFPCEGLVFRHEAVAGGEGEISGHYHPKAVLNHKGALISKACFIEDGNRIILPAFGAYTGGLPAHDPAVLQFFPSGYRLHVLGQNRIFTF